MAETSEVAMTDAPVETLVETSAPAEPAPVEPVQQQQAAVEPEQQQVEAVQPTAVAETQPAVPATDASALLSMNREQLAEFTAKVTSDASIKVDEMSKQMQAQQDELATLRAEHEKRVEEEQNQQRKAFEQKVQELKAEGFNQVHSESTHDVSPYLCLVGRSADGN